MGNYCSDDTNIQTYENHDQRNSTLETVLADGSKYIGEWKDNLRHG